MTKMILTGPADLKAQGFEIAPEPTLLEHPLYHEYRQILADLIPQVPQLAARPPRDYQARYAAMAACRDYNLLAHEQGLGKTYEAALFIWMRYGPALLGKQPKLRRGAIQICAPRHTLNLAWMKEFRETGLDQFAEVITSERQVRMSTKPIWLYEYDFLKRQTEHGKQLKKAGKHRVKINQRTKEVEQVFVGKPMWKLMRRAARAHTIVFDEIHMLRDGSDRTDAIGHYVRGVKNRLALTGTPVDGWVSHLAAILGVIYGSENRVFPWTAKAFTKRFTRERLVDMDYVTGEAGAAASKKRSAPGINPDQIPEFHNTTSHLMHRLVYRDPEVIGQVKFPPVRYHVERLPMDMDHAEYYRAVHEETIDQMIEVVKLLQGGMSLNATRLRTNVLGHLQLLRRASSCPWSVPDRILTFKPDEVAKIVRLKEICKQAAQDGRKVIVFTNFIDTGRILTQALKADGLNVLRIYASDKQERPVDLTQDMREDRIEDFLGNPDVNVLVGNLQLLSTGLTMVQASVVVHYDHDWKANTYKQGNSRIIRPGQVWPWVDVHDLMHVGTVDMYVFNALLQKVKATAEMIDRQFSLEANKASVADLDPLSIAKAMISGELDEAQLEEATA